MVFTLNPLSKLCPGPAGLIPDTQILAKLISLIDPDCLISSNPAEIWETMSKVRNSVLKGISFSDVRKSSIHLDGSNWKNLPFVEKKALHFEPLELSSD